MEKLANEEGGQEVIQELASQIRSGNVPEQDTEQETAASSVCESESAADQ